MVSGLRARRDFCARRQTRASRELASAEPLPESSARRVAPRPAPAPIARQSRRDSPMVASNRRPAIAAAVIEIGNAAVPRPARTRSRSITQPMAPPGPAGGASAPRSRIESATAPSVRTAGRSANRLQADRSGRCSTSRNDQASRRRGIKKHASPRLCHKRSASTAPSWPRKL